MCATFTFICLIPVDYDNEANGVDQNGIPNSNSNSNNNSDGDDDEEGDEVDEDEDDENVQPSTNSARPTITDDETVQILKSDSSADRINEQIDTNEINGYETQPTEQPAIAIENRNMMPSDSKSCDVNNGGCEQMCNMVPSAQDGENVVECSCRDGFYLDADTKCLGESYNLFIRLNFV